MSHNKGVHMGSETYELDSWSKRITRLQRALLHTNHQTPEMIQEFEVALGELAGAITGLRYENDELRRSVRTLQYERELFSDLFTSCPDACLQTDLQGVVRHVNPAAEEFFGVSAERLSGAPLLLFIAESFRSEFMLQLGLIDPGSTRRDWRLVIHPRNSAAIEVSADVARSDSESGQAFTWCVRNTTVDAQREREIVASRDELRSTFESMPYGLISVNAQWRITSVNAAAEILIGRTRDELAESELWDAFPDAKVSAFSSIGPRVMGSRGTEWFQVQMPGGVWIEGAVYPIDDGLQAIFQDVTQRKEAEIRNEHLEHEQAQFISRAAHELRSPLTAISGFVHTLARRRKEMSEADLDESFDWLRHASERMDQLISDLLDTSQLQRMPQMRAKPMRLDVTIERALQMARPPDGVTVDARVPSIVAAADAMWLEQAMINLLRNAYKYGGSHVEISTRDSGDHVFLFVEDDGPGVPSEFAGDLFEAFTRGPNASGQPGAGLGLAIVRRALESFGGTIWYEDREAGGARFVVRLPSAPENA